MTNPTCPYCDRPWIASTSPTTGCCDKERLAAVWRHINQTPAAQPPSATPRPADALISAISILEVNGTIAREVGQRMRDAVAALQAKHAYLQEQHDKHAASGDLADAEIRRLNSVITDTAQAWLDGNLGIAWEGGIDAAMRAAVDEIKKLRADLAAKREQCTLAMEVRRVEMKRREEAESARAVHFQMLERTRAQVATLNGLLGEAQAYIPRDPCTATERVLHACIDAARAGVEPDKTQTIIDDLTKLVQEQATVIAERNVELRNLRNECDQTASLSHQYRNERDTARERCAVRQRDILICLGRYRDHMPPEVVSRLQEVADALGKDKP